MGEEGLQLFADAMLITISLSPYLDPTVKGSEAALCFSRDILQVQMINFVPWQQSILEEGRENGR